MNSEDIELKTKIIKSFEDWVNQKDPNHEPWKDISEISSITGITTTQVSHIVETFDEFCENTKGEYTTRKLYEEHTSFFKKFLDSYRDIIE